MKFLSFLIIHMLLVRMSIVKQTYRVDRHTKMESFGRDKRLDCLAKVNTKERKENCVHISRLGQETYVTPIRQSSKDL